MNTDAYVASAIAHWAPRFVSNGVLLADFEEVTAGIQRWTDWCAAWSERAALIETLGYEALEQGYTLTAGEHLSRAAIYYHFAKFAFVVDIDQMRAAHMKAVKCKDVAAPYLRPPARRVLVPFESGHLAGLLRLPKDRLEKSPIVIMVPGLDSAKEELEAYEIPFLERGMATLTLDGPGQGESEYDFPIRGNYEGAVTAAVDWVLRQSELDASRIGLWGVSLGGYYAPRAAAFEKRIKACVALSGPYDLSDNWKNLPPLARDVFRARSHSATMEEAQALSQTLTLKHGVARMIECPLYIVVGTVDRLVDWQDGQRLASEVAGPVELQVVEGGNHIANNRPYAYRLRTADWMARELQATISPAASR